MYFLPHLNLSPKNLDRVSQINLSFLGPTGLTFYDCKMCPEKPLADVITYNRHEPMTPFAIPIDHEDAN